MVTLKKDQTAKEEGPSCQEQKLFSSEIFSKIRCLVASLGECRGGAHLPHQGRASNGTVCWPWCLKIAAITENAESADDLPGIPSLEASFCPLPNATTRTHLLPTVL